ncbi:MAG TPA: SGNH/GDSL hydrolase family protein [Xanthobacteraceae bacterium]|nr:SGNH/GDSL hydrolase family protein [Xanthobacteraceae bacterium]
MLTAAALAGRAFAVDPPSCAVPDNLLFVDNSLNRVTTAVGKQHKLVIAVFGTGSSMLAGADGPSLAYPARLEAALNQRLSNVMVRVATRTKAGQTAESMRHNVKDLLVDEKPDLVIWQTGTVDAIRRVEVDGFRAALEAGVDTLQAGGADVILMNMQYSPRTESMIAVGPYVDEMRSVAQQREVALFDRFAIMRNWSDEGAFDFYAAGRDNGLAQRVHDCLGRAIGTLVIEDGHLQPFVNKTGQ